MVGEDLQLETLRIGGRVECLVGSSRQRTRLVLPRHSTRQDNDVPGCQHLPSSTHNLDDPGIYLHSRFPSSQASPGRKGRPATYLQGLVDAPACSCETGLARNDSKVNWRGHPIDLSALSSRRSRPTCAAAQHEGPPGPANVRLSIGRNGRPHVLLPTR